MYKVPTFEEIQFSFKSSLANIFLENCHPIEKKLLGIAIQDSRKKPEYDSPVNCTDECITLHETEKIKACTHQDILDTGKSLLKNFQKEIEKEAENRLEDEFVERRLMLEAEKRRALELSRKEKEAEYENRIEILKQEMEEKSKMELDTIMSKSKKEMQKAVVQGRLDTTREILRKMRMEISYIVTSLYDEFDQYNRASREKMIADFNEIRRRERIQFNTKSKEFEKKTIESFREKIHALEMRNIVEICNVLCYERSRCTEEKQTLHENFQKQNQALQDLVRKLYQALNTMKEQLIINKRKKKLLEAKLCEIVGEFQKFINSSLDATTGQADYLLPLRDLSQTVDCLGECMIEDEDLRIISSMELNDLELKFCECIRKSQDWSKASVKSLLTNQSFSCCCALENSLKK